MPLDQEYMKREWPAMRWWARHGITTVVWIPLGVMPATMTWLIGHDPVEAFVEAIVTYAIFRWVTNQAVW